MSNFLLRVHLSDLIALPDPEAAVELDARMDAWTTIDKLHERSFVERGIIIREFERRQLWKHLTDPETGHSFPNLTAWLSCENFLGCRRTNFEAKRTLAMLEDVPPAKLIDIPKGNLHTLTQLSTAVRNQPDVLEAARTMPREAFEEKVEKELYKESKTTRHDLGREVFLERVEKFAQVHDPRSPAAARGWDHRRDQRPVLIAQVARIA